MNVCVTAELGDFASADAAIEEQLRLSREVGDLEMQGCAPHDLGMIHFERLPKLAEPYLLAALEVFKKLELQIGLAFTKLNLIPVKEIRMSKSYAPKIIRVERTCSIFSRIQMRKFDSQILSQPVRTPWTFRESFGCRHQRRHGAGRNFDLSAKGPFCRATKRF